jgi:UDP-glucose 4-epimerase
MKILVTGGAGFIGSHVVGRLLGNHEVICYDNFDPYYDPAAKRRNISAYLSEDNFELVEGDIRDENKLSELLDDVDVILHEASQPGVRASLKDPAKAHDVNARGTLCVLEAAVSAGVKRFINASSSSVYGRVVYLPFDEKHPTNPISPYGESKLAAEKYCFEVGEDHGIEVVSLRYFTVYGPRMRPDLAIAIFTERALKDEEIVIFGDGSKTRDFTYIDDAVDATVKATERGSGIYNIGGGSRVRISELAEMIIDITGSRSRMVYSDPVRGDVEHTWSNTEKARRELGWKPRVTLDEGLLKYVEWVRSSNGRYPIDNQALD